MNAITILHETRSRLAILEKEINRQLTTMEKDINEVTLKDKNIGIGISTAFLTSRLTFEKMIESCKEQIGKLDKQIETEQQHCKHENVYTTAINKGIRIDCCLICRKRLEVDLNVFRV
jgi:hypothetical protein